MNSQFRVLYREFLLRLVDLELLSADAQGDTNKLLGQFATVLISSSVFIGLGGLFFDARGMSPAQFQAATLTIEHFLIATTMLVTGLFAVLSWDSTFPDRKDVLVLASLPIRTRTLFLAKIAAVASGLGLAVLAFSGAPGMTWPLVFMGRSPGFLDLIFFFLHRAFFAYWISVTAAAVFLFCCVLGIQGVAALLPRRIFLRLSSFLQVAAFCTFLSVYFLEPSFASLEALGAPGNQRALAWLPSWWFLGLFQYLNGTAQPAVARLAWRALIGLAVAVSITAVTYAVSYFRTIRKVVEEPDIAPGHWSGDWAISFGEPARTAIVLFAIRTLMRSRRHRLFLSFYLGIGLAVVILFSKDPVARRQLASLVNVPLLIASVVMLVAWIVGTRVIFAIPLDLRANWIFRLTPVRGGAACLSAARQSLYLLGLVPAWSIAAVCFLWIWPWKTVAAHLLLLGLLGSIVVEATLFGFRKIPFTCSWLPGKSNIYRLYWGFFALQPLVLINGCSLELRALHEPLLYAKVFSALTVGYAAICWWVGARAASDEPAVQFEETEASPILSLGLSG